MPRIVLASVSPRRQELLRALFSEFEVDPAHVDEDALTTEDPFETAERLAREKARLVAARHAGALVIGGDTVVALPVPPAPSPLPPSLQGRGAERGAQGSEAALLPDSAEPTPQATFSTPPPSEGEGQGRGGRLGNSDRAEGWSFAPSQYPRGNLKFAKEMRKEPTNTERHLWAKLRGGKLGHRFRRQQPIGPFIVDFVCFERGLVIELDGSSHSEPGQAEYDADRERYLTGLGYTVLRITDDEYMSEGTDWVEVIRSMLSGSAPSPLPPSLQGRGVERGAQGRGIERGAQGRVVERGAQGVESGVLSEGRYVQLSKPKDVEDAVRILTMLQGNEHLVITGVSLQMGEVDHTFHDVTRVRFRPVSETEIREYVATGEPMDKAGAYGAQGMASTFVQELIGSYENVVGLPIERLRLELRALGLVE